MNIINSSIKNSIMNKTVIIIGSVALLGVGAFLYFKPKLTATTGAGETGAGTTGAGSGTTGAGTTGAGAGTTEGTPPAGTVLTTPEQVLQIVNLANQLNRANEIAREIRSLVLRRPRGFISKGNQKMDELKKNMEILNLRSELKNLGYKEVNGKAVKLVEVTTTNLV
jgi:hypothetical protein